MGDELERSLRPTMGVGSTAAEGGLEAGETKLVRGCWIIESEYILRRGSGERKKVVSEEERGVPLCRIWE